MGDNALFLQNGTAHQRLRRIMMPPFHGERIKSYAESICSITKELSESCAGGESFYFRPLMHKIALKVLLKILFNDRQVPIQQVTEWFETEIFKEAKGWKPWFNYSRLQPKFRALIAQEIEHKKEDNSEDLLTWLQLATDEAGQPLTSQELEDQILTLMITAVDPCGNGSHLGFILDSQATTRTSKTARRTRNTRRKSRPSQDSFITILNSNMSRDTENSSHITDSFGKKTNSTTRNYGL